MKCVLKYKNKHLAVANYARLAVGDKSASPFVHEIYVESIDWNKKKTYVMKEKSITQLNAISFIRIHVQYHMFITSLININNFVIIR